MPRPDRDTSRYFIAVGVAMAGTRVGALALPLVAVVQLDAAPGEVGLLTAASTAAFLVVGLPAGVWLDRIRRRGAMIAADLARGLLLASVPVAWALDRLTMPQLWTVVLLVGVGTVVFDVGAQSYLPHLVGRGGLGRANAQLATIDSAGSIAGPAVGGWLVHGLGAPVVVALHAAALLWSASWLRSIRRPEAPVRAPGQRTLRAEVREGVAYVVRQPVLRAVALAGGMTNVALTAAITMLPLVFLRDLGLSEADLGAFLAVGAIGSLIGAASSRVLARWLGDGRTVLLVGLAVGPPAALLPLVGAGVPVWLANLGWMLVAFKVGCDNALLVTFRQHVTPDHLLGRVNATMRVVLTGAATVGALLAGLVGEVAGPRAALWTAVLVLAAVWVPILHSPLRTMRTLAAAEPVAAAEPAT